MISNMTTTVTTSGTSTRDWLLPGVLLLVALAWIGGHFSGYPRGVGLQLLLVSVHAMPVVIVALALRACLVGVTGQAGHSVLLVVALCVKAFTVFAIVWAVTHPGGFGPHGLLDWLPIGTANAGAGLILLAFIRSRRARSSARSQ